MEQYAYIRVSTKEQHIDRQIMALKPYSISPKNIYHFKPMNKRSKQEVLFPESCRWCDCSNKDFAEWTCEGSLKLYIFFIKI